MKQPPTERQVLDWLRSLVPLVAGSMPLEDAAKRMQAYLPMLVDRYDSRDFNAASRAWVAERCKFWPSYGELCGMLDAWPKPTEPAQPSKPVTTDDNGLNDDDRMCIAWWRKRVAEGASKAQLDNLASIIRAKSFRAWEHIHQPEAPDKFTAASVQRSLVSLRGHHMRSLLTSMLMSAVLAKAPDLLQLLEDDALGEQGIGPGPLRALYRAIADDRETVRIIRESAQHRISRLPVPLEPAASYEPRPPLSPPPPLRDVTLKGEALRKSREARGLNVPVPEPEPEEALF